MGKEITVIPDIHGRTFWKAAVEAAAPGTRIVFLGDYLDPYPWEGITPGDATHNLCEIIALKKERPEDVVLLLGNHDMGYLDPGINFCRRDHAGASRNRRLLEENLELFDIVHEERPAKGRILFSHAGISVPWLERHRNVLGRNRFRPSDLNDMLHDLYGRNILYGLLSECSPVRGGDDPSGSPVWADLYEFLSGDELLPGYLHVFGHTQLEDGPVKVANGGVCVDCRRAFRLSGDSLTLTPIP